MPATTIDEQLNEMFIFHTNWFINNKPKSEVIKHLQALLSDLEKAHDKDGNEELRPMIWERIKFVQEALSKLVPEQLKLDIGGRP